MAFYVLFSLLYLGYAILNITYERPYSSQELRLFKTASALEISIVMSETFRACSFCILGIKLSRGLEEANQEFLFLFHQNKEQEGLVCLEEQ